MFDSASGGDVKNLEFFELQPQIIVTLIRGENLASRDLNGSKFKI